MQSCCRELVGISGAEQGVAHGTLFAARPHVERDVGVLLIRHGAVGDGGHVLWGRTPGIALSRGGRQDISRLAKLLAGVGIQRIISSPQHRTLQSAHILARALRVPVEIDVNADEFDFGEWTGRRFDTLEHDAAWRRFNARRSTGCAPGGETVAAFRARVQRLIAHRLATTDTRPCVVTHAEVIRTLVLESLGMDMDAWAQVPIDPASVTVLRGRRLPLRVAASNLTRLVSEHLAVGAL